MRYPVDWNNESEIRKLFSYQTMIGIAPGFGSRPIAWYQDHQVKAHDYIMCVIQDMKQGAANVRVRKGLLQIQDMSGKWWNNISTFQIYNLVDNKVRMGNER
jgi:hypothetical protein